MAHSISEKKKEDWMNNKWRPMMGWSYMLTCITDFVVFPILWSVLQSVSKGQVNIQWQPITLQGAGLYHIAMGAVLGIAAYGRTQEKLGGANNGGYQMPGNVGSSYVAPPAVNTTPVNTNYISSNNYTGNFNRGGNYNSTDISAPVTTGFRGKEGPVQPQDPEI
jgi:hypothetical protein